MITAASFIEHLRGLGYSQYTAVPCSFLKPFINYAISDRTLNYIGATSEGEAVGIAMGAYLAGRKTVAMCQNSGLGNMVNSLTSLNYPFRVPTLLITTWRGEPGVKDEPQHVLMGQITQQLLDTMRIPWLPFPKEESDIAPTMAKAGQYMSDKHLPFALVMSHESVAEFALTEPPQPERAHCDIRENANLPVTERMIRTEALQTILDNLRGNEAILGTTGKTGRELFTLTDRPNHLYVVGGMGTASAIAFGIAQALPHQPVVVLDGDGAALMKLGSLATIGYYHPRNLLHILIDNESHDSTGGQRTVSGLVRFARVAAALNYRQAWSLDRREDIAAAVQELRGIDGPSLLHIKIKSGSPEKLGRPTVTPEQVKERFMAFLAEAR